MGKGKEEREKRGRKDMSTSSVHIIKSGFYQIMLSKFLNILYFQK